MNYRRIHRIIESVIQNVLSETARTQPVDMSKINPYQRDIDDWGEIKDALEKRNAEYGIKTKSSDDILADFRKMPIGSPADRIKDKVQSDITDNIQQRALNCPDVTIGDDGAAYAPISVLNKELESKGMKIEVKGQTFSYGNKKLPPSTLIVNLTSATNCPVSNCPMRKICFGKGVERRYNNTLLRNLRNQQAFKYMNTKKILKLVETYIELAPVRIKNIRISEEGDFENQAQVDFIDKLAGHLKRKYGITTTCYTHQCGKEFNFDNCENLIVNMSDIHSEQGDRHFVVISPKAHRRLKYGGIIRDNSKYSPYFKCCCDCTRCSFCYRTKEQNGEGQDEMINVLCAKH